jgi:putative ATP-dependent endonuclease of the OLD family
MIVPELYCPATVARGNATMRLKAITISNFKGLHAAELEPTSFGCLVGENNAGKSSVLQAIVHGLKRTPSLPIELFYDRSLPVEFALDFDGITPADLKRLADEHRAKMEDLVADGTLKLFIRYQPAGKCEITTQRAISANAKYRHDAINAALTGKRGPAVKAAVAAEYPEFVEGLDDGATLAQAKEHLRASISNLPADQFENVEAPLPSGISSSITKFLPEPIYIPAVKNFGDDLKTTQSTSFGRLLGLLLEDMTPDLDAIAKSLNELDAMLNRIVDGETVVDQRHDKVKALESLVESFLSENFPRVKLELRVPPPELKAILNAAQIFVDDGSRDLIDNKGDGIKRSLTFALLQTYVHHLARNQPKAESEPDAPAPQPLIFLFEEPELYLHPRSQRILFATLGRISKAHQVVVTTHSPLFFAPGITASFVRVAKQDTTPKPVGHLFPVQFALDPTNAEVFRLTRFENTDAAFFSRRVVLFEGESDDAYCKHVANMLKPEWDFDQRNVALVKVSGKGNFAKYRGFFEKFGIEVKIVTDLDAMFEGYQHLGGKKEIDAVRSTALQTIDARIQALGIKPEPTASQIKDKVNGASWRGRYEAAKAALRRIQETNTIEPGTLDLLDALFVWEHDIARVRACRSDAEAKAALVPVLKALRECGICVLVRGAIEDYYPNGAPTTGPKPERALAAIGLVTTKDEASALSEPLPGAAEPELVEIFTEIFRDLP